MKYTTWPKPPIHGNKIPPDIPKSFSMFGTSYKTIDGKPFLDIPSEKLNLNEVKQDICKSFRLFMKLIKTMDGTYLNSIRDLHVHLNEKLNMAKIYEGDSALKEAMNKSVDEKIEIYESIKNQIASKNQAI